MENLHSVVKKIETPGIIKSKQNPKSQNTKPPAQKNAVTDQYQSNYFKFIVNMLTFIYPNKFIKKVL
jgi:hypothetical protein